MVSIKAPQLGPSPQMDKGYRRRSLIRLFLLSVIMEQHALSNIETTILETQNEAIKYALLNYGLEANKLRLWKVRVKIVQSEIGFLQMSASRGKEDARRRLNEKRLGGGCDGRLLNPPLRSPPPKPNPLPWILSYCQLS
ncbi:unnamed protein product [Nezara viridula]|uniref:Uncharacterized protein n=1 Tax=Nezara viridula TaxID=85310 RepID=A0A9P0H0L6_NEZVI|nr:unnamed protein product [Nezara viridula]